ncbi:MAG: hypothetical protein V1753_06305 [Pseudomonadota bacterium]
MKTLPSSMERWNSFERQGLKKDRTGKTLPPFGILIMVDHISDLICTAVA